MEVEAIPVHQITPDDDLECILGTYLTHLEEGVVVALTSKVLSILQNRCVSKTSVSKQALIREEADAFLDPKYHPNGFTLTLQHHLMMPAAGIDESNAGDTYILYPLDIQAQACRIWTFLKKHHRLEKLGVILTDSKSSPLRRGVTGVGLGWCGFQPLYSYVGKPDLDQRPLQATQVNVLDALAATAVFAMGEGDEQTPLVMLKQLPRVQFVDRCPSDEEERSFYVSIEDDLYRPILTSVPWQFKQKPA